MLNPYLWIVAVAGVVCFLVACGNGANDLANAFGTSYGSRVLTLLQIIVLAACCEFVGAVALGSNVATTMSGGIADIKTFENDPYCLMYGFLCTLGSSFIWLLLATKYNLPVSSHHAVAGGIIGFALVFGGGSAVNWAAKKDSFPFVQGVVPIIVSWFISPLLSGIVAAIIYSIMRFLVLERRAAVKLATYGMPLIVTFTVFLEFLFIFMIAASDKLGWGVGHAAWMAIAVAGGTGALCIPLIPLLRRRIRKLEAEATVLAEEEGVSVHNIMIRIVVRGRGTLPLEQHLLADGEEENQKKGSSNNAVEVESLQNEKNQAKTQKNEEEEEAHKKLSDNEKDEVNGAVVPEEFSGAESANLSYTGDDRHNEPSFGEGNYNNNNDSDDDGLNKDEGEGKKKKGNYTYGPEGMHYYDARAEYLFRYLQIFTAACTSLAHGSNDVSNSIGPFAAIYNVYITQSSVSSSNVPYWLLCIGGAGIVVGLATFGLNIMRLLGEKIAIITPVRGYSAELATALVVCFCSTYGIPISSTHCITGAVLAISAMDVGIKKVKWFLVLKMYAGWVMTLFITGVMSACFFSQGISTPIRGL